MPTRLPLVRRRCHDCGSERFRANGKFRVNANHKLLDSWLLVLCTGCGRTAKLTLLERAHVRSLRPDLLDRLHANDLALAAELLRDPVVLRRNRIGLDWDGAWRLDTGEGGSSSSGLAPERGRPAALSPLVPLVTLVPGCFGEAGGPGPGPGPVTLDVSVRFAARIPVRPVRLIAEGCGLPRARVERLIEEGSLVSAVRLSGKLSGDFTFTLKR